MSLLDVLAAGYLAGESTGHLAEDFSAVLDEARKIGIAAPGDDLRILAANALSHPENRAMHDLAYQRPQVLAVALLEWIARDIEAVQRRDEDWHKAAAGAALRLQSLRGMLAVWTLDEAMTERAKDRRTRKASWERREIGHETRKRVRGKVEAELKKDPALRKKSKRVAAGLIAPSVGASPEEVRKVLGKIARDERGKS